MDHGDQGEALLLYALNNEAHPAGIFQPESGTGDHLQPDQRPDESGEAGTTAPGRHTLSGGAETKAEELYQVWDNELNEVWDAGTGFCPRRIREALTAE